MQAAGTRTGKHTSDWPSACRLPSGTSQYGFTLIELLVVMVIIGILVTFASLAIGNDQEHLVQEETRRVAALIDVASDEATLQGRELGLLFTRSGYYFMFLAPPEESAQGENKEAHWVVLERDRLLRPRPLHPAIAAQLLLDGLPQTLPEELPEKGEPQLFLYSSGERTPFVLRLSADNGRIVYELEGGPLGPFKQRKAPGA